MSKFVDGSARRFLGRWGAWGLAFFALKGVIWLLLPLLGAAYLA